MESFKLEKYNTNEIHFNINAVPVSVQNKSKKKKVFKKEIKKKFLNQNTLSQVRYGFTSIIIVAISNDLKIQGCMISIIS